MNGGKVYEGFVPRGYIGRPRDHKINYLQNKNEGQQDIYIFHLGVYIQR
jgi:hypothetical protein